jgi:hypothetical protein
MAHISQIGDSLHNRNVIPLTPEGASNKFSYFSSFDAAESFSQVRTTSFSSRSLYAVVFKSAGKGSAGFGLFPCVGRSLLLARSYVVSQTANPTNPHIPHGPTVRLIPSFCTEDIWAGFADGDCRTIPVGKSLNGSAAYGGG